MPSSRTVRTLGKVAQRIPLLRDVPVVRLLMLAEVAILARDHIERLTPSERRRLVILVREGRGRPSNHLSQRERDELQALVAKADPKLFAREAAEKLAPVRLPKRFRANA